MDSPFSLPAVAQKQDAEAALAAELATKLLPLAEILKRYGLTKDELKNKLADPQFKHMVTEFRREWHSPLSSRDRVKAKAALAVEDGLLELHRVFYDPDTNASVRLDAYKQLVQLADMQPKKEESGSTGGGFSVTINIPQANASETKTVTLEHEPD